MVVLLYFFLLKFGFILIDDFVYFVFVSIIKLYLFLKE